MISFISGPILKNQLCCKFMLKYDMKYYLGQFMKTLNNLLWKNITHEQTLYV